MPRVERISTKWLARTVAAVLCFSPGCGRIGFELRSVFDDASTGTDGGVSIDASAGLDGGGRLDSGVALDSGVGLDAGATSARACDGGGGLGCFGEAWASAPLPYSSGAAASAILSDGVHYLGGSSHYFGDTRYRAHWVYNPTTQEWFDAPRNIPDDEVWGAQAFAYEDRIYLLGGYPRGRRLRSYDLASNSWTDLRAPPVAFNWGFAAGRVGSQLYAFGGEALRTTNAPGYCYDINTNTWTAVAPIPQNRGRGSLSSAVVGRRLYVLNGNASTTTTTLQIYDVDADRWSAGASLSGHRYEAATAVTVGESILFIGGANDQDLVDSSSTPVVLSDEVNIYDTVADRWSSGPRLVRGRFYATAQTVDRALFVMGGLDERSSEISDYEILAP